MQLKEYPVEACKLRLQVLDLSNNSLSGLPPEIGKVSKFYSQKMILNLVLILFEEEWVLDVLKHSSLLVSQAFKK